jgi:hypothetical protein
VVAIDRAGRQRKCVEEAARDALEDLRDVV